MRMMGLKAPFIVAAILLIAAAGTSGARALEAVEQPGKETAAPAVAPEAPAGSEAFAGRLFAGKVAKDRVSYACFVRKYDAAHLAQHPKQKVTAMRLLVSAQEFKESPGLSYAFRVGVTLRSTKGAYEATGNCSRPEASEISADKLKLQCGVECDGGGLTIELANADKSTLLRIEDAIRISRDNGSDRSLAAGADDRVFRLDRTSIEDCRSLAGDDEELADMRRP